MASNIWLISGGTSYYLSGPGGKSYSGSGTPWTSQANTPYRIAMNDVTGPRWTPQASVRIEVYGGGVPFRNGQPLVYDGYGNVIEQIPIQMRGSTDDNAIALLRQLRQILNTALAGQPCVLAVQPDTHSNAVYFEIYGADVQENPLFINDEAGHYVIRAIITMRRSPHGGLLSTGETVINGVSVGNTGTGSPDNVEAYTTGSGDLINEGQPLNVKVVPANVASIAYRYLWLSSLHTRTYGTTGAAAYSTSTTGDTGTGAAYIFSSASVSAALTRRALRGAVIIRTSSTTANAEMRIEVYGGGGGLIYNSPWIAAYSTSANITYMGDFDLSLIRAMKGLTSPTINVYLYTRSTDGSSSTVTIASSELLLFYTFCQIDLSYTAGGSLSSGLSPNGTNALFTDTFQEQTNFPCLPHPGPSLARNNSDGLPYLTRGALPRYYAGASLYLAMIETNVGVISHNTGRTATVTATHAPQWQTLRGDD